MNLEDGLYLMTRPNKQKELVELVTVENWGQLIYGFTEGEREEVPCGNVHKALQRKWQFEKVEMAQAER